MSWRDILKDLSAHATKVFCGRIVAKQQYCSGIQRCLCRLSVGTQGVTATQANVKVNVHTVKMAKTIRQDDLDGSLNTEILSAASPMLGCLTRCGSNGRGTWPECPQIDKTNASVVVKSVQASVTYGEHGRKR